MKQNEGVYKRLVEIYQEQRKYTMIQSRNYLFINGGKNTTFAWDHMENVDDVIDYETIENLEVGRGHESVI